MLGLSGADDKNALDKISIEKLSKTFVNGKLTVTALQALDLRVKEGEFICIVGPSGCGKTTLLRILAGFEQATAGRTLLEGQPLDAVPPHRRPAPLRAGD